MITLSVDEVRLLDQFRNVAAPEKVYDPSGKLLGLFVPAGSKQPGGAADVSEIQRRLSEENAGSFGDVVARLKVMTEESKQRRARGEADFTLEEAREFLRSPVP